MVDIKQNGFYIQKDNLSQDWKSTHKASQKIKKGDFKGRSFQIYSSKNHHQGSWKLKKGAIAFAATFFSLGFALISPKIQLLWKEAISGKEYIKVLIPVVKPSQIVEQNKESPVAKDPTKEKPSSINSAENLSENKGLIPEVKPSQTAEQKQDVKIEKNDDNQDNIDPKIHNSSPSTL